MPTITLVRFEESIPVVPQYLCKPVNSLDDLSRKVYAQNLLVCVSLTNQCAGGASSVPLFSRQGEEPDGYVLHIGANPDKHCF